MSKINLILSISLNPDYPVACYSIQKEYWNQDAFATYVNNRQHPNGMKYDVIDRASFHRAGKVKNIRSRMTVAEGYENNDIKPLYIPTGYPEMNPVEQAFKGVFLLWLTQPKFFI